MTASSLIDFNILALDYGRKRIGLAIKPTGVSVVSPLCIIDAQPLQQAMDEIRALIRERDITLVVTGLPLFPGGEQAGEVKRFTRKLRMGVKGVRWKFVDETLTSEQAIEQIRQARLPTRGRPLDDYAAALILETFLGAPGSTEESAKERS